MLVLFFYSLGIFFLSLLDTGIIESAAKWLGNDRTLQIEVRPDGRTSSLWVRPDA